MKKYKKFSLKFFILNRIFIQNNIMIATNPRLKRFPTLDPFYVVREDEVTQGFLRNACRPQPSFHFSHAPEIVFQRRRRKVGVGEVIRSADVQRNGAAGTDVFKNAGVFLSQGSF